MLGAKNRISIIGEIISEPTLLQAPNTVATLVVETTESYQNTKTGIIKSQNENMQITLFNKLAEIAVKYLKKGNIVCFEGRLACIGGTPNLPPTYKPQWLNFERLGGNRRRDEKAQIRGDSRDFNREAGNENFDHDDNAGNR